MAIKNNLTLLLCKNTPPHHGRLCLQLTESVSSEADTHGGGNAMLAEVYWNWSHEDFAIERIEGIVVAHLMTVLIDQVGKEPFVAIACTTGNDVCVGKIHIVKTCGICHSRTGEIGIP